MTDYWREVPEWCLGENNTFGTCFLAMAGNLHALVTAVNGHPEVMSDGEIEYADHAMTGFNPLDPRTDVGMSVQGMLDYWLRNGWPGEPTLKPLHYAPVKNDQLMNVCRVYGAACTWAMLPKSHAGQWDFSDAAIRNKSPGVGGHAMLMVDANPSIVRLVSWKEVKVVSREWWDAYGGGQFAVLHPQWKLQT